MFSNDSITNQNQTKREHIMDPLSLEPEVCRACLATDVKLFDMANTNLSELLTDLTKIPVQTQDVSFRFICYICRSKLCNYAHFRRQCHEAYSILHDIQDKGFLDTNKHVINSKLTANYMYSKIQVIYTTGAEDMDTENENFVYLTDFNDVQKNNHDLLAYEAKRQDFKIIIDDKTETKTDTIEQDMKVINEPIPYEDDFHSDDIGFEMTDVKKETERIKTKSPKTKRIKCKLSTQKKKKKFNRYNEKFEEDFEEFCKKYSLEVVFLSKEQQIERFQKRIAEDKYKLKCEFCSLGFKTETAHQKHLKMHDPSSGEYKCDICLCRYPTKVTYMRHRRGHKKEFVCKLCDKVLCNSNRAKMHHLWHKGFQPECKLCNKKFNIHSSYLNHVREHHTLVPCKECRQTFQGTIALGRHRNDTHSECKTCNQQFKTFEALSAHTAKGCNTNETPCLSCGLHFPDSEAVLVHTRAVHDGRNSAEIASSYLCELCAKSFSSPINLKTHQSNVHSGQRPFACPHCPKAFTDRTKLAVHINTHTGARPYGCKQCPEMFKSYAQRYKHKMRVHSLVRPHACGMCEKTYVLSNDLKWHIRYAHLHEPRPPRNRVRKTKDNV